MQLYQSVTTTTGWLSVFNTTSTSFVQVIETGNKDVIVSRLTFRLRLTPSVTPETFSMLGLISSVVSDVPDTAIYFSTNAESGALVPADNKDFNFYFSPNTVLAKNTKYAIGIVFGESFAVADTVQLAINNTNPYTVTNADLYVDTARVTGTDALFYLYTYPDILNTPSCGASLSGSVGLATKRISPVMT